MKVFILKSFPFAANGINAKTLEAGTFTDINDNLVAGLDAAGLVTTDDAEVEEYRRVKALDLENGAFTGAPEIQGDGQGTQREPDTTPVEIPEAWADLPWPELRALAAKVSEEPIKDKDGAIDAITAELAARGQAPAQD
ncbi:hypothetical protein JQX09_17645 [Sulfitobacter pseudonitzschiae]|uniref:Uncharacterized protein n=1 Tax=Pseudosulfitobacter pseudonitzschiae TaxID=1402135 RepID=A0A9Q2NP77_9RHOB|nr:hypothetical protein [Pseudosulfitobacter pseudonitzschiae]MBM2293756.1 hypothetical protein [Pseudosulfitobacter pseudonitzschiae]MBM2298674.1 hypothetical protein [Pseudosulfitobacter pseudonitzschiae]MBM2303588.1 hypothetical protein [Pseudosulfitobacter pseudonitzschiae]MBM2313371.1 hypothetical protein [Pseudosulfitobacter pseudonitzschiae]MBM2318284.1 hypothetical protein [Pseudosulfitobacter pseudonitzschiae]